jgi:hypothetical protein
MLARTSTQVPVQVVALVEVATLAVAPEAVLAAEVATLAVALVAVLAAEVVVGAVHSNHSVLCRDAA